MQLDPTLLAALCDPTNDADDGLRLVISDWFEVHDQPERAEFVRVQVELTKWHGRLAMTPRVQEWLATLRRRERELLGNDVCAHCGWHRPLVHGGHEWQYRRGFVHAVTCTAANWLAHADAILVAQPVREVRLTTRQYSGYPWRNTLSPVGRLFSDLFVAEWPHVRFTLPSSQERELDPLGPQVS